MVVESKKYVNGIRLPKYYAYLMLNRYRFDSRDDCLLCVTQKQYNN